VEVAGEEIFSSKNKRWFYPAFKEFAEDHWTWGLVFWILITFSSYVLANKFFISNPTLFMVHLQHVLQRIRIILKDSFLLFYHKLVEYS
jgi:hypothetical protein